MEHASPPPGAPLLKEAADGAEQPALLVVELVVDRRLESIEAGGQAKNPASPCPSNASRNPFDRKPTTIFHRIANPERK